MDIDIDWQRDYKSAMDSVDLINAGKSEYESDEEWAETLSRNIEHLQIIVAREGWPEEFDLSPMHAVIPNNG